jgi:hypothetical protein
MQVLPREAHEGKVSPDEAQVPSLRVEETPAVALSMPIASGRERPPPHSSRSMFQTIQRIETFSRQLLLSLDQARARLLPISLAQGDDGARKHMKYELGVLFGTARFSLPKESFGSFPTVNSLSTMLCQKTRRQQRFVLSSLRPLAGLPVAPEHSGEGEGTVMADGQELASNGLPK